jgi:hypothetical protein
MSEKSAPGVDFTEPFLAGFYEHNLKWLKFAIVTFYGFKIPYNSRLLFIKDINLHRLFQDGLGPA